jgi:chitinase
MIKFLAVLACAFALSSSAVAAPFWTTAYYAGWRYNHLPHDQIDFRGMTHIAHSFVMPKPDGTLDATTFEITPERSKGLVETAHENGVKVLMSLGGAGTGPAFRGALKPENRAKFIANTIDFAVSRGYDGIDIDFEPMEPSDHPIYIEYIRELRIQTNKQNPPLLLTCAAGWDAADVFVKLQNDFDQVNIMTYDLSGNWPGWQTYHNAPLRHTGLTIKGSTRLFPSVEHTVAEFLQKGMERSKLGIGAAFYGKAWLGATGPIQPIDGVKVEQLYLHQLLSKYYKPERYRWDERAGAAYLSVDEEGTANDAFVSYEDERALRDKVLWARREKLGGLIIWELANGYLKDAPEGKRHPLLEAVRAAREEKLPEGVETKK